MRFRTLLLVAVFLAPGYALAQDRAKAPATSVGLSRAQTAKVVTKGAVTLATPASQPVPAPVDPIVKQPKTPEEAMDAGKDFIGALKAKRWWFATAVGIFILLFVLGLCKVWERIGTTWAWIAVGVLSLAAGCFAAFDKGGFNWGAFITYLTAGPTIAWFRDLVKDVILKKTV